MPDLEAPPPDSPTVADVAASYRSLYVHLPFCRRRCPYCDFAVVALDEATPDVSGYTSALLRELSMVDSWETLDAVNFGGGTPSATPVAELGLILDAVAAGLGVSDGAEISIEVNPEDATPDTATQWRMLGFTRMSLGVQSFDDDVLTALGRTHTSAEAVEASRIALDANFDSLSLDLIYGTPAETAGSWERTVETAVSLEAQHVSAYALTVELGTELSRSVAAGAPSPDADDQADRYDSLSDAAADAGLVRYEVSNFARPGYPCRYNLGTWAQGEYEAIGLGAHGHRGGVRYRNVRRLDAYLAAIDQGDRPRAGVDSISGPDAERERLMLGVRRAAGVAPGESEAALRSDTHIARLIDARVVELTSNRLKVLQPLLTDEVARAVLALQP